MISRIEGPSSLSVTAPVKRATNASRADKASFSKHLSEAEEADPLLETSALGSVSGVLNIQEVDDALARAARGKLRAEDLLDRLDDLRLDILGGALSKAKLLRLAEAVRVRRPTLSDPKLTEILDEIDLRAQVELAKFTRA